MDNNFILDVYMQREKLTQEEFDKLLEISPMSSSWAIEKVEQTEENLLKVIKYHPEGLRFISKKVQTEKMAREAIKKDKRALEHMSKKLYTYDLLLDAVSNGCSLSQVPSAYKTPELCLAAIKAEGYGLKDVPEEIKTNEMCLIACSSSQYALEYVPSEYKTKEFCEKVISKQPLSLEYVPSKYKTVELCLNAIKSDCTAARFAPKSFFNDNRSLEILKLLATKFSEGEHISSYVVAQIHSKMSKHIQQSDIFIASELLFGIRTIDKILYDNEEFTVFGTTEDYTNSSYDFFGERVFKDYKESFSSFDKLYEFVIFSRDLKALKEMDYDFAQIDRDKYPLLFDDVEDEIINIENSLLYSHEDNEIDSIPQQHDLIPFDIHREDYRTFYYISDIHLDAKISKEFPKGAKISEIREFILSMLRGLLESAQPGVFDLIILGDVSYNWEIVKVFYTELSMRWPGKIFVVLGNHELWSFKENVETVETIVEKYRTLSDISYRINVLHNDLYLFNDSHIHSKKIVSQEEILSLNDCDLRNLCQSSPIIILGSTGFSGLNKTFNADNGIYRDTIKDVEMEKSFSKEFEQIYKRLSDCASDLKVIVATHMPKIDWTELPYMPNWIYLNGHSHVNNCILEDDITLYADNQVGYYSKNLNLKHFYTEKKYNRFEKFSDGIYKISKIDYVDFYRNMVTWNLTFKRSDGIIYLLKRSSVYMFIFEENEKLYLLSGGALRKLETQDINYYFENMVYYADSIKESFANIFDALDKISYAVKLFGGSGKKHGCIVDIDPLNHIYLNIYDGTITPYYALSVIDKFVYPSVEKLLEVHCKELLDNYRNLLGEKCQSVMVLNNKTIIQKDESLYNSDTLIYKTSNYIRSLQYLHDANVIRDWNDQLIYKYANKLLK